MQELTGQEYEVRVASEDSSMVVVEQELEALRTQVEELSDEVWHMLKAKSSC